MATIPKYVENILARSQWKAPYYMAGKYREGFYTFTILKETNYTTARVFQREVERFVAWANREAKKATGIQQPVATIISTPKKTRHAEQYAVVKIVDPIMKQIEDHIVNEVDRSYINDWYWRQGR